MRFKFAPALLSAALFLAISLSCALPANPVVVGQPATATAAATGPATGALTSVPTSAPTNIPTSSPPSPTPAATDSPSATPIATTGSEATQPAQAESVFPNWTKDNHNPKLVLDGQGRLDLFYQSPTTAGGVTFNQSQLKADGTWTPPVTASQEFAALGGLWLVPDAAGRQCMLWSGKTDDADGNNRYGLWRNCQQDDGAWLAQSEPLALTDGWGEFLPVRATDDSLQAGYEAQGGLLFSPVGSDPAHALTATAVSITPNVRQGRLAIDSNGGYHAAWVENRGNGNGPFSVRVRDSSDGGKTWGTIQQIYTGTAQNQDTMGFGLLAGAAGGMHLVWDGDNAVHYSHWSAGTGWVAPLQLSGDDPSGGVTLAVSAQGLARAIWNVSAAAPSVVLRLQAFDGTWSDPRTVTPTKAIELAAVVDASGATQVVWSADDGLHYLDIQ